jgi:hypothetical protein
MWPLCTADNLDTFICDGMKFDIYKLPETLGTVQPCTGIASPVICVPYCLISFNCSLEPSLSFTYKAVPIVVNLPDLQFERYPISGAFGKEFYSTATVIISTCVHPQYFEIRNGGFENPANTMGPNSIRMKTTNFCMSFSCHLQRYVINI